MHSSWCAWMQAGALAGALCSCTAGMADAAGGKAVAVAVSALAQPDGGVLYRYSVRNPGAHVIVGLLIDSGGRVDAAAASAPPNAAPGTSPDARDSAVPESPPGSPAGWRGIKITTEEMSYVRVKWHGSRQAGIQPGQGSAAFEVLAPRPNPLYLHARWTIEFADAPPVSGQL